MDNRKVAQALVKLAKTLTAGNKTAGLEGGLKKMMVTKSCWALLEAAARVTENMSDELKIQGMDSGNTDADRASEAWSDISDLIRLCSDKVKRMEKGIDREYVF